MAGLNVDALRELQASINASIDRYVDLASTTETPANHLANAQNIIASRAGKLVSLTENPVPSNVLQAMAPGLNTAIRVAIDLNLFEIIETPTTILELSKRTSADPILLLRLLRVLSSYAYFTEVACNTYASSPHSRGLRIPSIRDWLKMHFDYGYQFELKLPAFLASINYRNPDDFSNTLATFTCGEQYFEHLHKFPDLLAVWNSSMTLQEHTPPSSKPTFPFERYVKDSTSPDMVTLVDVGGGRGGYLESLRKAYPALPGRLILQDLPKVIAETNAADVPFELMAHDFFSPQPVHGARFYHLRRILHDWADNECRAILTNLAKGFKQGYSSVLINEFVLPDVGCSKREALLDLTMMRLNGMERNRRQWEDLLGSVGFKIKDIHRAEAGCHSIIEAVLVNTGAKV